MDTKENPRAYPDRPYVGVGVVVFRGEEVLLAQRGKKPRLHSWSIPGGAQELGETIEDAAHREILEETGLEIEILGDRLPALVIPESPCDPENKRLRA